MIARTVGTGVLLLCLFVGSTLGENQPPNIVFLLSDDQRADMLGCAGNSIIQTPCLDQLAQRGTFFENAFVTTSICMSSRASIMTGQHALRHGVNDFRTSLTAEQLANSYFGQLKQAGYRIGFIGKWGVGKPPQDFFDFSRAFSGQGSYYDSSDPARPHLTRVMGDQALEFLGDQDHTRPFCLSVSFKSPHVDDRVIENPFTFDRDLSDLYKELPIPRLELTERKYFDALPLFLQSSENRKRWKQRFADEAMAQDSLKGYYRLITGMDMQIARIRAKLVEQGIADNTVIIFTSDNGFYLGERGLAGKWYAHEPSLRVPLIIYDPRLPESLRGKRCDQVVLNIDIPETILDYAGLSPPSDMQGKSLKPLVDNACDGKNTEDWRSSFFYGHYLVWERIPQSEALRTPRWKYITYFEQQPLYEELYDLQADPLEKTNLANDPQHASTLTELRRQHAAMRASAQ